MLHCGVSLSKQWHEGKKSSNPVCYCFCVLNKLEGFLHKYHISSWSNSNQGYRVSTGEIAKSSSAQKAVETKQLSPRLAGEWFRIPNTAVSRHVAKKYAKFGTVRPVVSAVLGEGGQKSLYGLVSCFLSRF